MKRRERSAPIWLFSFVDLAFLLLIALTQLAPDPGKTGEPVAELTLPRIAEPPSPTAEGGHAPRWQLRVHPLAGNDDPGVARAPFELIDPGASGATDAVREASVIGAEELAARLDVLRQRNTARPLLAPHRDARSEDLLAAVAILEGVWSADRRVAVEPVPEVSAAR